MKKWLTKNKWYIVYTLIPIVFVICTAVVIKGHPQTDTSITIYGVKTVEHDKATSLKISQMVLTDGKVIDNPTLDDIRDHNLLTYHDSIELEDNQVFQTSRLN